MWSLPPPLPPSTGSPLWQSYLSEDIVPQKSKMVVGKVRLTLRLLKASPGLKWSEYKVTMTLSNDITCTCTCTCCLSQSHMCMFIYMYLSQASGFSWHCLKYIRKPRKPMHETSIYCTPACPWLLTAHIHISQIPKTCTCKRTVWE